MTNNYPRVEVVQPEWVKDPSKWPFGGIILPAKSASVKRLMLDARTLAKQLRCPKDLVTAFLRLGQLHEASTGEIVASLGLCAEDLTALGLAGVLCTKYDLRLGKLVIQVLGDLRQELLDAPRPLRVILGILRADKGLEARVGTCEGDLAIWDVPKDQAGASDYYDASDLRDRMDEEMHKSPLWLPRPESCLVSRPRS